MSILDITTIYDFRAEGHCLQVEIDIETGVITEINSVNDVRTVAPSEPGYPATLTAILDANYPRRRWIPIHDDYTRNKSCAQRPWSWVDREQELRLEMNLIHRFGSELVADGCLRHPDVARLLEHVFVLERESEEAHGPSWTNSRLGLLASSPSTVLLNQDHEDGQCLRQFMWEPSLLPVPLGGWLPGEDTGPDLDDHAALVGDPSSTKLEPKAPTDEKETLAPHGLKSVDPMEEFDYTTIRNFAADHPVLRSTLEISTGNLTEVRETDDGLTFVFLMPGDADYPSTLTPILDKFYRSEHALWGLSFNADEKIPPGTDEIFLKWSRRTEDQLSPWFWVSSGDLTTELTVETRMVEKFGARLEEIDRLPSSLDAAGRKLRLSTHLEIWRTLHYLFIEDREKALLDESWAPGTAHLDREIDDPSVIWLSVFDEEERLQRQYSWTLSQKEEYQFDQQIWRDHFEQDEDDWFAPWEFIDPDDEFPPADPTAIAPLLEAVPGPPTDEL